MNYTHTPFAICSGCFGRVGGCRKLEQFRPETAWRDASTKENESKAVGIVCRVGVVLDPSLTPMLIAVRVLFKRFHIKRFPMKGLIRKQPPQTIYRQIYVFSAVSRLLLADPPPPLNIRNISQKGCVCKTPPFDPVSDLKNISFFPWTGVS